MPENPNNHLHARKAIWGLGSVSVLNNENRVLGYIDIILYYKKNSEMVLVVIVV